MPKDKRDVEAGLLNKGFQQQPGAIIEHGGILMM